MIDWTEVQTLIGLQTYTQMGKETDDTIVNRKFNEKSSFQKSLMFKLENALKEYSRLEASAIEAWE